MKTFILKKLFTFMPLLVGVFSFTLAEAQIVYTNIPDTTVRPCLDNSCSNFYFLDLNSDDIWDFSFVIKSNKALFCSTPYNNTSIDVYPLSLNSAIRSSKLEFNEIIDDNNSWSTRSLTLRKCTVRCVPGMGGLEGLEGSFTYSCAGDWSNPSDGFLSLRISINNRYYYGWIRLSIKASGLGAYVTIKDHAYNSRPDNFIKAGEGLLNTRGGLLNIKEGLLNAEKGTFLSNEDFSLQNPFTIFPNPVTNGTSIVFGLNQPQNVSLRVFDLNGRLVAKLADRVFEAGKNELKLDTDSMSAGIYFLQFQTEENFQTKKFVVMK